MVDSFSEKREDGSTDRRVDREKEPGRGRAPSGRHERMGHQNGNKWYSSAVYWWEQIFGEEHWGRLSQWMVDSVVAGVGVEKLLLYSILSTRLEHR